MINQLSPKIFFSAAETSADRHAAAVVRQLRAQIPPLTCEGLGGDAMTQAGCNLLENLTDRSAMLLHAVSQVGFYFKLLRRVKRYLRTERPDLVVLVDAPAWNLHLAKAARSLQIPVLYYIAPQLWAWGPWRLRKFRRRVDHLACILPFEEDWFNSRGVNATYVGHPLFDEPYPIEPAPADPENHQNFPTVALLPGSRKHEINSLWLPMQRIGQRIKNHYPAARFIATASNDTNFNTLDRLADPTLGIELRQSSIEVVTRHADLTLVASGTATLEVAAQNCPMIVLYHVPQLQWLLLGRWLLKTDYVSLVNILANRPLVPEFVPFNRRIDTVARKALELLADPDARQDIRLQLRQLLQPIIKPGAAQNTANLIKKMLPNY